MLRRLFAGAVVASAAMLGLGAMPASAQITHFDHVYVIMMENQSFDNVIGRNALDANGNILGPDAPAITSLAGNYGLATLYFGVTHPSLPNYLTTISGDFFGVQDDANSCFATDPGTGCHRINATNLVDTLEAHHLTWVNLQQTMPTTGFLGGQYPGPSPRLYAQKHNPFVYFQDIATNPARLANNKPLNSVTFGQVLSNPPNFTYIVPDQCHDMHGTSTCPNFDPLVQAGDREVNTLVSQIMSAPTFTNNSAIFVVWDEDDYSSNFGCCSSPVRNGGGHTIAIVVSKDSHQKRSATPMNHYSLLKTIEQGFNLPLLGHSADADVPSMFELL